MELEGYPFECGNTTYSTYTFVVYANAFLYCNYFSDDAIFKKIFIFIDNKFGLFIE